MIYAYTRPRYQVSVYKTIGPLVLSSGSFPWHRSIRVLIGDNDYLLNSLAKLQKVNQCYQK